MLKYALTMLNIGFAKNNGLIKVRILYTEYFWTLQIDPNTQRVEIITHICSIVNWEYM